MSYPQGMKDALRAVLVEKGDYATLAQMIREDEKRDDETKLTKLIEPMSAVADILTQNAKGAFMGGVEEKIDAAVETATKDLKKNITDAQKTLAKEIQDTLTAKSDDMSRTLAEDVVTRIAQAQDALETAQARYTEGLVNAKAEAMFANLADLARLSEDEIADIIERSALSVESQIQGIIGDYIKETGITVSQINDFKAEVQKLIPQYDFSRIRITSAQVAGLPDFSGAASRVWVEKKIASIDFTPYVPFTGGTMTGALTPADHGTATNPEVVAVVYGTGTPPTASTTPEGTLWVKYTP